MENSKTKNVENDEKRTSAAVDLPMQSSKKRLKLENRVAVLQIEIKHFVYSKVHCEFTIEALQENNKERSEKIKKLYNEKVQLKWLEEDVLRKKEIMNVEQSRTEEQVANYSCTVKVIKESVTECKNHYEKVKVKQDKHKNEYTKCNESIVRFNDDCKKNINFMKDKLNELEIENLREYNEYKQEKQQYEKNAEMKESEATMDKKTKDMIDQTEIKQYDINIKQEIFVKLEKENEDTLTQLQSCKKAMEDAQGKNIDQQEENKNVINALNNLINEKQLCLTKLEEEIQNNQEMLIEATDSINKLQASVSEIDKENTENIENIQMLENELFAIKNTLHNLTNVKTDLLVLKVSLLQEVNANEIKRMELEHNVKIISENFKEIKIQVDKERQKLNEINTENESLENVFTIEIKETNAKLEETQRNNEEKLTNLTEKQINLEQSVAESTAALSVIKNEINEVDELSALRVKQNNYKKQIAEKQMMLKFLSNKEQVLENERTRFQASHTMVTMQPNKSDLFQTDSPALNSSITVGKDETDKKVGKTISILKSPRKPATPTKKVSFDENIYEKDSSDSSYASFKDTLKPEPLPRSATFFLDMFLKEATSVI